MSTLRRHLASTAFGIALALFLAEGLLHFYNPLRSSVVQNRVILLAHNRILVPHADGRVTTFETNSLGFRGPEPPADWSQTFSILAIGGSTTEGFYSDTSQTWPLQMQEHLRAACSRIFVNNAGISGHSTQGHLVLMEDYVARLRPTIALFLVGINDVDNASTPAPDPTYNFLYNASSPNTLARVLTLLHRSELVGVGITLKRWWRASRMGITYREHDLRQIPHRDLPEAQIAQRLERVERVMIPAYIHRLEVLLATTRKAGILPIVLTQPALYGEEMDPVTGISLATLQAGDSNGREMARVLAAYNRALIDTATRLDVNVIDLASMLPRRSDLYRDFIHFTDRGEALVGEILAEQLRPLVRRQCPLSGGL